MTRSTAGRVLRHVELELLAAAERDLDVAVEQLPVKWRRVAPDVLLVRAAAFRLARSFAAAAAGSVAGGAMV